MLSTSPSNDVVTSTCENETTDEDHDSHSSSLSWEDLDCPFKKIFDDVTTTTTSDEISKKSKMVDALRKETVDKNRNVNVVNIWEDLDCPFKKIFDEVTTTTSNEISKESKIVDALREKTANNNRNIDAVGDEDVVSDKLRMIEMQYQIRLMETNSMHTENSEKTKTIEEQAAQIEDLTKQLSDGKNDDLVAENLMKSTVIADYETKIQEIECRLDLLKYEASEALRAVINVSLSKDITSHHGVTTNNEDKIGINDIPIMETFNTIMKASTTFGIPQLIEIVDRFVASTIERDSTQAVDFLINHDLHEETLSSLPRPVSSINLALECIRSNPKILVGSNVMHLLNPARIESILMDQEMQTDEFTLFCILSKWSEYKEERNKETQEHRFKIAKSMSKLISMEYIDPVKLSTIVRSTGLVSDTELCDAFGKQTKAGSVEKKFRKSSTSSPKCTNNTTSSSLIKANWEKSGLDVLVGTNNGWLTDQIVDRCMKKDEVHKWKFRVEETGPVLFGVASATYEPIFDPVNQFGVFLPKANISKGSIVVLTLRENYLSATMNDSPWADVTHTRGRRDCTDYIPEGLFVAASVQNRAKVQFLGFYEN
jgi:hypothetical protein